MDEVDLVKLLVEAGADVRARCWGPFFKMTGNTFFGATGWILVFANSGYIASAASITPSPIEGWLRVQGSTRCTSRPACAGLRQPRIWRCGHPDPSSQLRRALPMLMRRVWIPLSQKHGALVSDRDTHGNTALHMASPVSLCLPRPAFGGPWQHHISAGGAAPNATGRVPQPHSDVRLPTGQLLPAGH